jgi:hypothetical protein
MVSVLTLPLPCRNITKWDFSSLLNDTAGFPLHGQAQWAAIGEKPLCSGRIEFNTLKLLKLTWTKLGASGSYL